VFRAELARMAPVTEIDESAYPIDKAVSVLML
jgi:hypothetical protein